MGSHWGEEGASLHLRVILFLNNFIDFNFKLIFKNPQRRQKHGHRCQEYPPKHNQDKGQFD